MCRKRSVNLCARLRRSRALAVCLGQRRIDLKCLDVPRGRPSNDLKFVLDEFKARPIVYDPESFDDRDVPAFLEFIILERCSSVLSALHLSQGWFEVVERGRLLGTSAYVRIRTYDLLCLQPDLFMNRVGRLIFSRDENGMLSRRVS